MSGHRSAAWTGAWLVALACAAPCAPAQPVPIGSTQSTAQLETPRITTDSREYCDVLGGRVAVMHRLIASPPPEAITLASEGERLCAQGQYRSGVARLRRALALLRGARSTTAHGE